jgi:hypothetical protein
MARLTLLRSNALAVLGVALLASAGPEPFATNELRWEGVLLARGRVNRRWAVGSVNARPPAFLKVRDGHSDSGRATTTRDLKVHVSNEQRYDTGMFVVTFPCRTSALRPCQSVDSRRQSTLAAPPACGNSCLGAGTTCGQLTQFSGQHPRSAVGRAPRSPRRTNDALDGGRVRPAAALGGSVPRGRLGGRAHCPLGTSGSQTTA